MDVRQVIEELEAELDPLEVYDAFRGENTYLLQSAEGGEKTARFSIIGINPIAFVRIEGKDVSFDSGIPALKRLHVRGQNPIESMRSLMSNFKSEENIFRFCGGFVGYFSYDIVRHFVKLEDKKRRMPDCEFVLARNNIIFDHIAGKTYLTANVFEGDDVPLETEMLKKIKARLHKRRTLEKPAKPKKAPETRNLHLETAFHEIALQFRDTVCHQGQTLMQFQEFAIKSQIGKFVSSTLKLQKEFRGTTIKFESNVTKEQFEAMVCRAKEYIVEGDIFQVVPSQQLSVKFKGDAFAVYKLLKEINPSPYMYFLDFGARNIVGSSPEMLVRVENRTVWTYPIAGTRGRGETPAADKELETEMLCDEKERAEHIMLVDLGRNDIGRVAKFGTVKVTKLMGVEKYSHVQHMVSEVVGKLRDDKDEFDALQSVFPAGTVSGAPKVRAMEIINELEPDARGLYAGAVGYLSFNHNLDTAIAIRTMVIENGTAYTQAGGGVVADSIPEKEYEESMNKAGALIKAVAATSKSP